VVEQNEGAVRGISDLSRDLRAEGSILTVAALLKRLRERSVRSNEHPREMSGKQGVWLQRRVRKDRVLSDQPFVGWFAVGSSALWLSEVDTAPDVSAMLEDRGVEVAAVLRIPPRLIGWVQFQLAFVPYQTLSRPRPIAERVPAPELHDHSRRRGRALAEQHQIAPGAGRWEAVLNGDATSLPDVQVEVRQLGRVEHARGPIKR